MPNILPSIEESLTDLDGLLKALDDSAIGEAIPFIDRAIKVWRTAGKFRDAVLARKLLSFITNASLQTADARARMREHAESEEGKKIGETPFPVLDRLNDMQKPVWLAKSYAAYLSDEFSASDFRRLASAIDIAFSDDLIALITTAEPSSNDSAWKQNLVPPGLTSFSVLVPIGGSKIVYRVTDLGQLFQKAVLAH